MLDFIWDAFGQTGDIHFYLLYKTFEQEYKQSNVEMVDEGQNQNTPLC